MDPMEIPKFTTTYHHAPYDRISPSSPSLSLKGKTVLITGGGRGIGRAISRNFFIAGANVFIIGRSEGSLKETVEELTAKNPGDQARIGYQSADVTNPEAVKSALAAAVKKFGSLEIVVNNVGYINEVGPTSSADLMDFWTTYELNVKAGVIVVQEFLKYAKAGATFINISSGGAMGVFGPMSAYSSSKLAFVRIMDYVAAENPELRVFNIQPGVIETDMSKKSASTLPTEDDPNLPGAFSVWLLSPEADFLKGRFVWANWDVDELLKKKDVIVEQNMLTFQLSGWPLGLQD